MIKRVLCHMEIFSHTHQTVASRIQLTQWISLAWDQVSDLTPCRRISQVMTSMKTATQSSDTAAVYNDALTRVSTLLGKNFKVVAPVTNYIPTTSKAEVNISYLMAGFLTCYGL